jgi:hypothetical protein
MGDTEAALRGSTLGGNFRFRKGRKAVVLGVWAARGPLRPFQKMGGFAPPFARVSGAPGASQTPKMNDLHPPKESIL